MEFYKYTMAKVRLKDIAEVAKLSLSTVSRALNNDPEISLETVKYVKLVAEQMGYIKNKDASSLRTGTNQNIVLVSVAGTNNNDIFFSPKYHAMQDGAFKAVEKTNLSLFILPVNLENIIEKLDTLCKENKPQGLIIDGQYLRVETIKAIQKFQVPMVVLQNNECLSVPNIMINQDVYVYEAIKSLMLKDVKKIYLCHSLVQNSSSNLYKEGVNMALNDSLKQYDIRHQYEELFSNNAGFSSFVERVIRKNKDKNIGFIVSSTSYSASIYSACARTKAEIGKTVHLATLTSIPEFFAITHVASNIWFVDFKELGTLLVDTLLQFISGVPANQLQKNISPTRIRKDYIEKRQQAQLPKETKITILDL